MNPQDIVLEKRMDLNFLEEIYTLPGGEQIKKCIQCGTCSGSCPVSYVMDYTPRKLFAMIRAGMRDEVLNSETIWICVSCYSCAVRCPMEIKITDIMYLLKNLAIKENKYHKGAKAAELGKIFVDNVMKYGRNYELGLMAKYILKADPFLAISNMKIGLDMLKKKKLSFMAHKIKGLGQLKSILKKAEELGGI